jgi:acyl carrier protein
MGLDVVELVMAVEEEFEVEIPNEVQEKLITVGDLADAVVAQLASLERPADPVKVFDRIRKITAERAEAPPERVTRETSFLDDLGMD